MACGCVRLIHSGMQKRCFFLFCRRMGCASIFNDGVHSMHCNCQLHFACAFWKSIPAPETTKSIFPSQSTDTTRYSIPQMAFRLSIDGNKFSQWFSVCGNNVVPKRFPWAKYMLYSSDLFLATNSVDRLAKLGVSSAWVSVSFSDFIVGHSTFHDKWVVSICDKHIRLRDWTHLYSIYSFTESHNSLCDQHTRCGCRSFYCK